MGLFDQQPSDKDLLIQFLQQENIWLRERVEAQDKTLLAIQFPAAYAQRYPREQAARAASSTVVVSPSSPQGLRNSRVRLEYPTHEDVEKSFERG